MKYKYETKTLEELCAIKTGTSVSRAKKANDGENEVEVRVLLPKAMSNGSINVADLASEKVGAIGDDFYTQEGDVVLKLSTPFDAAYVSSKQEGILVTSFGIILRKTSALIDMRYLSMFLNSKITSTVLAAKSSGQSTVKLLRRADVAELEIPLPSIECQELLAELYQDVCQRKKEYERLIALDDELIESQLTKMIWGE